jgi:hypothetical protein
MNFVVVETWKDLELSAMQEEIVAWFAHAYLSG